VLAVGLFACGGGSDITPDAPPGPLPAYTVAGSALDLAAVVDNLHIAGTPCGAFNMMLACPTSGNVMVSGSSQNCPGSGTGIENFNYTYTMMQCEDTPNGVTIRLDGTAVYSGSLTITNGATTSSTTNFQAQTPIAIHCADPSNNNYLPVDETCAFAITLDFAMGSQSHVSGMICGESFTH
jgi:hypothetical protein